MPVFTTLRIYALSRKNRILGGVALVVSMAPFLINAVSPYSVSYNPAPADGYSHRAS